MCWCMLSGRPSRVRRCSGKCVVLGVSIMCDLFLNGECGCAYATIPRRVGELFTYLNERPFNSWELFIQEPTTSSQPLTHVPCPLMTGLCHSRLHWHLKSNFPNITLSSSSISHTHFIKVFYLLQLSIKVSIHLFSLLTHSNSFIHFQ